MTVKRGQGQGWELRLGAVQMVVWLGSVVGAVVGAYFVGFFQGKYVGFETGRATSGVEVAKLAVTDSVSEVQDQQSASAVYDKLTATSTMVDTEVAPKKPTVRPEDRTAAKVAQDIKLAEEQSRVLESAAPPVEARVSEPPTSIRDEKELFGEAQKSLEVSGGAFPDQGTDEPDLFDSQGGASTPSNVRMLGSDVALEAGSKSDKDKSLGEMLDERIDQARGAASPPELDPIKPVIATPVSKVKSAESIEGRVALVATPLPTVVKEVAAIATRKPNLTTSAPSIPQPKATVAVATPVPEQGVRKLLPSGFFAQVAAPSKLVDAESVARRLKKSGFPAVIEEATINGSSYYRVLVGPEENKIQADRLLQQLQSERYLTSVPFIKRVK